MIPENFGNLCRRLLTCSMRSSVASHDKHTAGAGQGLQQRSQHVGRLPTNRLRWSRVGRTDGGAMRLKRTLQTRASHLVRQYSNGVCTYAYYIAGAHTTTLRNSVVITH